MNGAKKNTSDSYYQSRYRDAPGTTSEWEIDRRFVAIEYNRKLGEGAFGQVLLGMYQCSKFEIRADVSPFKTIFNLFSCLACGCTIKKLLLIFANFRTYFG